MLERLVGPLYWILSFVGIGAVAHSIWRQVTGGASVEATDAELCRGVEWLSFGIIIRLGAEAVVRLRYLTEKDVSSESNEVVGEGGPPPEQPPSL